MYEMRKFVAPEFVFGDKAVELVGRYAANFGARNALVVTDKGVINSGIAEKVFALLAEEGVDFCVFSDVSPNPREVEVMAGAEYYGRQGCDIIVSVGGGSPMDCAKGIGIVSTNGGHVLDYEGIDNVPVPGPPLICVPTTAGTSADVSQFAIITNGREKVKIAIVSKTVVPDVALIDPYMTMSMDPYLTSCTGVDALVHAFEAYVSTAHSPITDLHALDAIRLIFNHLPAAVETPDDPEQRGIMALASLEAGLAFSNASLGAVHAMAHSCGGLLDLPHGECNAILLDHVVAYNFEETVERYRKIAGCLGIDERNMEDKVVKKELLDGIRQLKKKVGIEEGLQAKGVRKSDIAELAGKAMNDPCMVTNPRLPSERDIEVLYEEAL